MFLIKAKGKVHLWSNDFKDNFLAFVPKHLKCEPSDLDVYWIDGSHDDAINTLLKDGLDHSDAIAGLPKKKLRCWPYDATGKFLGNSLED